jgi:3-deoxy-7-phosphoheptulonate synthase
MIENVAKGAIAAGADGIMVEVHNNPKISKSDGIQSLTIKKFSSLMEAIRPVAISVNRKI